MATPFSRRFEVDGDLFGYLVLNFCASSNHCPSSITSSPPSSPHAREHAGPESARSYRCSATNRRSFEIVAPPWQANPHRGQASARREAVQATWGRRFSRCAVRFFLPVSRLFHERSAPPRHDPAFRRITARRFLSSRTLRSRSAAAAEDPVARAENRDRSLRRGARRSAGELGLSRRLQRWADVERLRLRMSAKRLRFPESAPEKASREVRGTISPACFS